MGIRTIKCLLALLIILPQNNSEPEPQLVSWKQLKNLLPGTWACAQNQTIFYEHWCLTQGDTISGLGYFIKNGDTQFTETIKVYSHRNNIIYAANAAHQNKGKTIKFKSSIIQDSLFQFENARHDFPKSIEYDWRKKNEMHVKISKEVGQAAPGTILRFTKL